MVPLPRYPLLRHPLFRRPPARREADGSRYCLPVRSLPYRTGNAGKRARRRSIGPFSFGAQAFWAWWR